MVTNAWLKIYELLNFFPELLNSNEIKSFHICEAPGAFISGLNHFLSDRKYTNWTWYAQSLKSGEKFALDDHYGLIDSYPHKWLFGDSADDSGDITHSYIIKYYARHRSLQNINFMTADAGLFFDPVKINKQEILMAKITTAQIITILACLSKGGHALLKVYLPMAEPSNISLIQLLSSLFDGVSFAKPLSSSPDNSEFYIILKGYHGMSRSDTNDKESIDPKLELLLAILDNKTWDSKLSFSGKLDHDFLSTYTDIMSSFIDRQIHALSRSYYYYYHYSGNERQHDNTQELDTWIKNNGIKPLLRKLIN